MSNTNGNNGKGHESYLDALRLQKFNLTPRPVNSDGLSETFVRRSRNVPELTLEITPQIGQPGYVTFRITPKYPNRELTTEDQRELSRWKYEFPAPIQKELVESAIRMYLYGRLGISV